MIPQERSQPIAAEWTRQPGDTIETDEKIRKDPQYQVTQKSPSNSPDHFGPPSKNVRTQNNQKGPQEQSGPLKIFSVMDTDEKPSKVNIQVVRLRNL